MEHVLPAVCFFAPTLVGGFVGTWLALKCVKPWRAFLVGLSVTVLLGTALGAAVAYAPVWGSGWSLFRVWMFHLLMSPFVGVPLGAFCAARVQKRQGL